MMNGWSPGRFSLATPTPDLFPLPPGETGLSAAETAAVAEASRLVATLGGFDDDDGGFSIACTAGVTAAEAIRRLEAVPVTDSEIEEAVRDSSESLAFVGVTDVPGGCVVVQPWGYVASNPGVMERLSVGTVCHGLYDNPKSGNQGAMARDGVIEAWDTHPGGGDASFEDPPEEILAAYLYDGEAVAYCYAEASLRPADDRSLTGKYDVWLKLPGHLL
ncbi:ankyrin repeat domain-containing protein [Streptosporangium sp. NPDC001559]|uniref:ankyrin repeat domain-containing protein n=1 Tax=Streptosporangium sp. NPDC001559 TaxID=3366187 RepID=UPI0036E3275E